MVVCKKSSNRVVAETVETPVKQDETAHLAPARKEDSFLAAQLFTGVVYTLSERDVKGCCKCKEELIVDI